MMVWTVSIAKEIFFSLPFQRIKATYTDMRGIMLKKPSLVRDCELSSSMLKLHWIGRPTKLFSWQKVVVDKKMKLVHQPKNLQWNLN